jgi:hypothetical protein
MRGSEALYLSRSVAHQASCTLGLAVVVLGVLLVQITVRPVTGSLRPRGSRPPGPSHSVGSASTLFSSSSLVVISS